MKLKIALTCAALMLAPSLGLAMGCGHGKEKQAMSCETGTVYDAASGTCVTKTT